MTPRVQTLPHKAQAPPWHTVTVLGTALMVGAAPHDLSYVLSLLVDSTSADQSTRGRSLCHPHLHRA